MEDLVKFIFTFSSDSSTLHQILFFSIDELKKYKKKHARKMSTLASVFLHFFTKQQIQSMIDTIKLVEPKLVADFMKIFNIQQTAGGFQEAAVEYQIKKEDIDFHVAKLVKQVNRQNLDSVKKALSNTKKFMKFLETNSERKIDANKLKLAFERQQEKRVIVPLKKITPSVTVYLRLLDFMYYTLNTMTTFVSSLVFWGRIERLMKVYKQDDTDVEFIEFIKFFHKEFPEQLKPLYLIVFAVLSIFLLSWLAVKHYKRFLKTKHSDDLKNMEMIQKFIVDLKLKK